MSLNESVVAQNVSLCERDNVIEPCIIKSDSNVSKIVDGSVHSIKAIRSLPENACTKTFNNKNHFIGLFSCNCFPLKSVKLYSGCKETNDYSNPSKELHHKISTITNNSSLDRHNSSTISNETSSEEQSKEKGALFNRTSLSRFRMLWEQRKSAKFKNCFRKSKERSEEISEKFTCSQNDPDSSSFVTNPNICGVDELSTKSNPKIIEKDKSTSSTLLGPALETDREKKCLIIDLDETLVHSSFKAVDGADFRVSVEIDGINHQVYVLKRPHVDEFLKALGGIYECVLFTASLSKYADPVADFLDKDNVFKHRLFRESCVYHRGNFVKDLSQLGRPIDQVVILDNSPASYMFHATHAIQIISWFDDMSDRALLELIPYFQRLSTEPNVVEFLRHNPPPSKYAVVGSFDVSLLNSAAASTRSPIASAFLSRIPRLIQNSSSSDTTSSSNSVCRSPFVTALSLSLPKVSPISASTIQSDNKKEPTALTSSLVYSTAAVENHLFSPPSQIPISLPLQGTSRSSSRLNTRRPVSTPSSSSLIPQKNSLNGVNSSAPVTPKIIPHNRIPTYSTSSS